LSRTPQRPSIIRPAPGRYVNVGIEEGFRSSSCLVWLTSCSFGRSTNCALQPMSAVKSKTEITDLNRIILSSHLGDYGSPNMVSQKGKDEPRSQYLGQIVQIAQDLIVGEYNSILAALLGFLPSVAVGTALASGPPHRSVREGLPHTALTSGSCDDQPFVRIRICSIPIPSCSLSYAPQPL